MLVIRLWLFQQNHGACRDCNEQYYHAKSRCTWKASVVRPCLRVPMTAAVGMMATNERKTRYRAVDQKHDIVLLTRNMPSCCSPEQILVLDRMVVEHLCYIVWTNPYMIGELQEVCLGRPDMRLSHNGSQGRQRHLQGMSVQQFRSEPRQPGVLWEQRQTP